MQKIKVTTSYDSEAKSWRQIETKSWTTRNGNIAFKLEGQQYICNPKTGIILQLDVEGYSGQKRWFPVGRRTRYGEYCLGDFISYREYQSTPEAVEKSREFLKTLLARRST